MNTPTLLLSGAVAPPPPFPFRPPRRDGSMSWEEAIDRHRHQLAVERDARRQPWSTTSLGMALDEATQQLVELQAGVLDLLDEGRLGDDDPVRGLARLLDGVELEAALDLPQEWIPEAAAPRLVEPPKLTDELSLRRRWQRAQRYTDKPVKLSLLGPCSFACRIENTLHGADVDEGAHSVAEALRPGLLSLAEAGCPALELVEPALVTATPRISERGIEAVARALHRVPRSVRRWLRLVAADSQPPWLGASPPALGLNGVADLLEQLPIDGLVVEPATALADPALLARWQRLDVALLAVPATADATFPHEVATEALATTAAHIEPHRIHAAVDGGGADARVPLRERLDKLSRAVAALA